MNTLYTGYINPIQFENIELQTLESMDLQCLHCKASYSDSETNAKKIYTKCCRNGTIMLETHSNYPVELVQLLNNNTDYRENIRNYNNAFAFASFVARLDKLRTPGIPVFRIVGQTYHNAYSLRPNSNSAYQYAQLYILDNEEANRQRLTNN